MYGSLDISTSGMIAQRVRLETASANLANQHTLLDSSGNVNPYRRKEVLFAPGLRASAAGSSASADAAGHTRNFGVRVKDIISDQAPVRPTKYDPTNPFAFKEGPFKGYVATTGINPVVETVNAMEAVRAYEANVMAAEATKQMTAASLRLLG